MVIPDVNVLIYAYNSAALQHKGSAKWLKNAFEGGDIVGLCWPVLWGFIRVTTNLRLWPNPKSMREAFGVVADLQGQPNAVMVHAGPRHTALLKDLLLETDLKGSEVSDGVLAAIAIEHAATLASTDRDFRRFSGLRWINPLED